ncbi:hypothetical protein R1sor_026906 [Riccia sorocarpa]|uniref:Uncharacterized protein n=1 Tax=Riccia sorocarpa TaxID=122646 RepID=A0ABD3GDF1_9MARC
MAPSGNSKNANAGSGNAGQVRMTMSKTKTELKARYDTGGQTAGLTLAVAAGDLKLKGSVTDATFTSGPSLNGMTIGIEKPGHFLFDYDLAHQSARFQFMTSVNVLGKPIRLTYIHPQKRNATLVEGSLIWDPRNKVTAKYSFATEKGSLKYTYLSSPHDVTIEPGFDFNTNAWNFSVSKKLPIGDNVKATFDSSNSALGLEWVRDDKYFGPFKIVGSIDGKEMKAHKLTMEKTWNHEI